MALEQAAFEQQPFAVDLEEIHRAGGGAGRAEEMDFHAGIYRLMLIFDLASRLPAIMIKNRIKIIDQRINCAGR